MNIFSLPTPRPLSAKGGPVSLALGNFDGLHLAHRALLETAGEGEYPLAVFTFCEPAKPYLTSPEERLALLEAAGVKTVFWAGFECFRALSCEDFVRYLKEELACRQVACGFNFRFGRGASGDASVLKNLADAAGIACRILPEQRVEGKTISSSAIRSLLREGEVTRAARLLGRSFSLAGTVAQGFSVGGSRLNTPTVNLPVPEGLVPLRKGVYVTHTALAGEIFPSVTNWGSRPTFDRQDVTCETYLLDVDRDLYGQKITVFFDKFLRPEKKFPTEEALKAAIAADIAAAAACHRQN